MQQNTRTTLTILAALSGLLVLVPAISSAQTAEDALRFTQRGPATGVRMTGLASRGFSGIDNHGALHSNPAGLGFVQGSLITGSMDFLNTTNEVNSSTAGFDAVPLTSELGNNGLGSFAYLFDVPTVQGSLTIGLGLSQVNNFNRRLGFEGTNSSSTISSSFLPFDGEYFVTGSGDLDELNELPFAAFNGGFFEYFPDLMATGEYPFLEAVIPGSVIDQTGSVREEGRVYEGSLGGAIEMAKGIMFGVSANLVFGEYSFDSRFDEYDTHNQNGIEDYNVLQDDGSLLEGFDQLTYRQRLQSDLVGFNLRAGVSAQVTKNMRAGIALETPTWTYTEESFGAEYTTYFDDGGRLSYGDRADDVGSGYFDYDLRSPWRLGAGVQLQIGDLLTVFDAEYVDWSQLRLSAATDEGVFDGVNRTIEEQYGTVFNLSAGGEYKLGPLVVRGGVALRPDPFKSDLVNSTGTTLNRDRRFVSGGLGVRLSRRSRVDMAWTRIMENGTWLAYPEDSFGPRQDHVLQFDESLRRNLFVLEFTYRL